MPILRILGLDIGDVNIGVAISDPLGLTAQPLELIKRDRKKSEIRLIKKLVDDYSVEKIVVGLPRATDGNLSEQGKKIKKFADSLGAAISIEIIYKEEYLTTQMAEEILIESGMRREKRKTNVDKIAAALILQGYLDSIKFSSESPNNP